MGRPEKLSYKRRIYPVGLTLSLPQCTMSLLLWTKRLSFLAGGKTEVDSSQRNSCNSRLTSLFRNETSALLKLFPGQWRQQLTEHACWHWCWADTCIRDHPHSACRKPQVQCMQGRDRRHRCVRRWQEVTFRSFSRFYTFRRLFVWRRKVSIPACFSVRTSKDQPKGTSGFSGIFIFDSLSLT